MQESKNYQNTLIAVRLQSYIASSYVNSYSTQVTSNTILLEEMLSIGEVSGKSLLRAKIVIFRNTESLAFLLWILCEDPNLQKNKSVDFVNHLRLIITSRMMAYTIVSVF